MIHFPLSLKTPVKNVLLWMTKLDHAVLYRADPHNPRNVRIGTFKIDKESNCLTYTSSNGEAVPPELTQWVVDYMGQIAAQAVAERLLK